MPFRIRKRIEFIPFGLGAEWPPVAPIREDPTQYELTNISNVIEVVTTTSVGLLTPNIIAMGCDSMVGVELGADGGGAGGSLAWPAANRAIFIPLMIQQNITIYKLYTVNGSAAGGNVDVGIYSKAGSKLVSSGATAQAGTSALQKFDITDTALTPGQYYFALSCDSTTPTFTRLAPAVADVLSMFGCQQDAAGYTLPATASFADITSAYLPRCGLIAYTTDPA